MGFSKRQLTTASDGSLEELFLPLDGLTLFATSVTITATGTAPATTFVRISLITRDGPTITQQTVLAAGYIGADDSVAWHGNLKTTLTAEVYASIWSRVTQNVDLTVISSDR